MAHRGPVLILGNLNRLIKENASELDKIDLLDEMIELCNDKQEHLPKLETFLQRCSDSIDHGRREKDLRWYAGARLKPKTYQYKVKLDRGLPMVMEIERAFCDPNNVSSSLVRGTVMQGTMVPNKVIDVVGGAKENAKTMISEIRVGMKTVEKADAGDKVEVRFNMLPKTGITEGQLLAEDGALRTYRKFRAVVFLKEMDVLTIGKAPSLAKYHIAAHQGVYEVTNYTFFDGSFGHVYTDNYFDHTYRIPALDTIDNAYEDIGNENVREFAIRTDLQEKHRVYSENTPEYHGYYMDIELSAYTALEVGMPFVFVNQNDIVRPDGAYGIVLECVE